VVTTGLFKPQSCFKAKAIRLGLSAPSFGNRNIDHIGTCNFDFSDNIFLTCCLYTIINLVF